jgi:putative endonuclease
MKKQPRARLAKALGQIGEKQAVDFLLKKNYLILEKNFRFKLLEIDIIALDQANDELVFVEVKTRSSSRFGDPSQAVDGKKLRNLVTAAQIYLKQSGLNKSFRFDIISLLPDSTEHFENITADF